MSRAEEFHNRLIALQCVDRDAIEATGICPDTAARMMRDPIATFQRMTIGERVRFWPLVEKHLEDARERAANFVRNAG